MPAEIQNIIELRHLRKRFKKVVAVSDLSLSVPKGEIFGFLGPNGAGKSTVIRIMVDLVRPDTGSVELFGLPIRSERKNILRRIGSLVEKPDFYGYLTGRENLLLFAKMLNGVSGKQVDEVLEIVKLETRADDKTKSYSHGMKQRLGIAQTLLGNPELIILDEPTIGLDPEGMKEVRELIFNLRQREMTIFLSSHLLHEVEMICSQMAVINQGKLVIQGSVKELLRLGPMTLRLDVDHVSEAVEKISRLPYVKSATVEHQTINVELPYQDIPALNHFLVEQNIKVYRLQPQTTLEDYYLSLIGNENVESDLY